MADQQPKQYYSSFSSLADAGTKVAIVYSDKYNIRLLGLEKLHPFDSCKYANVAAHLDRSGEIQLSNMIEPCRMPTEEELLMVHTREYLDSLQNSTELARITQVWLAAWIPMYILRPYILNPLLYATSGTVLAGYLAVQRGAAVNLGGGFHHCSGASGGGFCAYADITLSLQLLRRNFPSRVRRAMIIDLDVHQGNGHENAKRRLNDNDLYIVDVYNPSLYPCDYVAAQEINVAMYLGTRMNDASYLAEVQFALDHAFATFQPDVIYYNAGTDIMAGDPLGQMYVTPKGIIQRDEIVFQRAVDQKIPIVMVLSGGYQSSTAAVIGDSILNLKRKFNLFNAIL